MSSPFRTLTSVGRVLSTLALLLASAVSLCPGWPPRAALAQPAATPITAGADLEPGADRQTGIRGRVTDRRTGRPLEAAPVLIQGGGRVRSLLTDARGVYQANLPPGSYVVRSYFDLYHGARVSGARVDAGRFIEVSLVLSPIDEQRDVDVQEIEIPYRADTTTAAAQDQLRQASTGIGEGMGAKQMSQVGASDAGSAAAKVVGVTIEQSQLIVRGLGGRYNRVLLNGIPVPSTDPDSPGVDLDLFPTGVIDSLNLSKAFSPDTPADFAGGVMEIKSVTYPRELILELELAAGFNSESTFRDRVDYRGGKYDFLGFDDGRRALPDAIPAKERLQVNPNGRFPTPQALEAPIESFRNSWQYDRSAAPPSLGLELTVGDSKRLAGGRRVGYLATASYDRGLVRRLGISRPNPTLNTGDGSLVVRNDYQTETGGEEVQLSALATASVDLGPNHAITALTLFNRTVSDETLLVSGNNQDLQDNQFSKWQLDFLARQLWFNQLFGDHRNLLGTRLRFRWAGFHAYGLRDEPDRRTVSEGTFREGVAWLERPNSGERFFSRLRQDDLGATASLRFPLWPQGWGNVGGWLQVSPRTFLNRRFRMQRDPLGASSLSSNYLQPVESLFSPAGIGPLTTMVEETRDTDSYESTQKLYAGYLLLETPLVGPLSFAGGLRTEILSQEVRSRSPFTPPPGAMSTEVVTERTDVDYLPGGALKYQLTAKSVARAAYGMTVSRPQIRELAPFQFYDFLRERSIEGNPLLERTLIQNLDLRWEWFFGEGEIAAISGFYKHFDKPIELQLRDPDSGASQFINADSAWNVGAELELRLALRRLGRGLRPFSLDSNLALIHSQVKLPAALSAAVRDTRRLFGQSPYVFNVSLRFNSERGAVTAAAVYNVVGPRITDVGTTVNTGAGLAFFPDTEESPFHSLDFVASAQVARHFKLKLKVRNILLQDEELYQGSYLTRRRSPGLSASLGLVLTY